MIVKKVFLGLMMNINAHLEELLINEFVCYYLPDEVPLEWDNFALDVVIPDMARRSSRRLRSRMDADNIQSFVALLKEVMSDPENPLTEKICGINMIDWREDPEDWKAFYKLLSLIIQNLETESQA
jgi:hypothetical protein